MIEIDDRTRVAIVGAGLSGLTCASTLAARGHTVRVFDKGRGPGGRASTRRAAIAGVEVDFDHGAQYFTVRQSDSLERLSRWIDKGVARSWNGRIAVLGAGGAIESYSDKERYVGTPGMSALCQDLASGLDVRFGVTVDRAQRAGNGLAVYDVGGRPLGVFDFLVVTAPPPQARAIISGVSSALAARAASVSMSPCWAVMMAFERPLRAPYDGAFINAGPLSWAARTSSKPARSRIVDRWVLHGSPEWSRDHLERSPDFVESRLLDAFYDATGIERGEPCWIQAHRWRYALAHNPLEVGSLFDSTARIALCGDWTNANRVEGALLSGSDAAARIHAAALD